MGNLVYDNFFQIFLTVSSEYKLLSIYNSRFWAQCIARNFIELNQPELKHKKTSLRRCMYVLAHK